MTRILTVVAAVCLVAFAGSALAEPSLSKNIKPGPSGTDMVLVDVSASDRSVYGILVEDATGSVDDIIAPKGWVGISVGDAVLFRTTTAPIQRGETVTFKIMTTNSGASYSVSFRDDESYFGTKQSI